MSAGSAPRARWRAAAAAVAMILWLAPLPASAAGDARLRVPASGGEPGGPPGGDDTAAEPEGRSGLDLPSANLPGRLELHRPNYMMPITWPDDGQGDEDVEFKFQISLRHQIGRFPVYVAYTQTAYLRWLDQENSRPFREINFNPEIWYRLSPGRLSPDLLDWLGIDFGFEHESNGEDVPGSRSWDRIYVRPWFEQGPWRAGLKLWARIPEEEKEFPLDPSGDDNPRILDFYGHHELKLGYSFDDGDWAQITTRYALSDDRGALRLRYASPTPTRNSYYFIELFSGYGESLETFQENRTRIGFGFALLR